MPVPPGDYLGGWQQQLVDQFPTEFGGIYASGAGFVVGEVHPDSVLESTAASLLASASAGYDSGSPPLSFARVARSLQDLYQIKSAILADPTLIAAGVTGAGLDVEASDVVVAATSSSALSEVQQLYGDAVETMVQASSSLDAATRYTDVSPWNGGDAIVGANGENCTSGFGVHATLGRDYLLTAGHCGDTSFKNDGNEVGSSLSGSVSTSVIDSQLISTVSSCISWGGLSTEPSNDVRYYITGYSDPLQGASLLEEGSASHEQSVTVSIYDWSGTVAGESLEDLDLLQPQSVGGGDSGGTVVYPTIYGPLAGGTIVGVDAMWHDGSFQSYDVVQLIDSELYTYSSFLGSQLLPNVTTTGDSC